MPNLECLLEKQEHELKIILNENGTACNEAHKLSRAIEILRKYTGNL